MISGEVVYRHANLVYRMRPGDSLLFDADAPHGLNSSCDYRHVICRSSAPRNQVE